MITWTINGKPSLIHLQNSTRNKQMILDFWKRWDNHYQPAKPTKIVFIEE